MPNHHPEQLGAEVIEACRRLGFALAGICDAAPTRHAAELVAWLEAGKHGSMAYLSEHLEARLDPARVLPGARSVVMVGDLYSSRHERGGGAPAGFGKIAAYARGRDYHTVIKRRLHKLCDALSARFAEERFRAFVDTAPVLEREYAARAGLGWIGKHTLLIHPRLGSYMLLGGVLTTLELSAPAGQRAAADHCGTCTRCIDACPTGAITPYSVDATRCISYLTIERRGPVDPRLHGAMGEWLFGCDICQEVCPHNSERRGREGGGGGDGPGARPEYQSDRAGFDPLSILGWGEEDRRREFQGSALKRATLAMMKRNALIVAANLAGQGRVDAGEFEARLKALAAGDEPELVRETAAALLGSGRTGLGDGG